MTAKPGQMRSGIFNWELPNVATGAYVAGTSQHRRQIFRIWQTAVRFRVHMSNRSQLNNLYAGGTGNSNINMYMGVPARDASGEFNGNFVSTPIQIVSGASHASNAEFVSNWIDRSVFALDAGKHYMLSFSCTSGGQFTLGGGLTWVNTVAGDAGLAVPGTTMTRQPNQRICQMWIEYEFVDDGSPLLWVVGNSRSNASNNGGVDNPGELSSFAHLWAAQHRGIVASIAVGGIFGSNFNQPAGRWAIYDGCNIPLQPTAVLYQEVVSSDLINEGGTYTTSLASHRAVVGRGRTKFPNARHISSNIGPRIGFTGDSSSGLEKARLDLNTQLHLHAGGVDTCIDIDSVITDGADPARIHPRLNADDTHGNARFHAAIASLIPVGRQSIM